LRSFSYAATEDFTFTIQRKQIDDKGFEVSLK